MRTFDKGRLHISATCAGTARRIVDESLRCPGERWQSGKPIVERQLLQAMLADSQIEFYAAESTICDAARRRDAGDEASIPVSCRKLIASEMVGGVADRASSLSVGRGAWPTTPSNASFAIRCSGCEGASEIQKLVMARRCL